MVEKIKKEKVSEKKDTKKEVKETKTETPSVKAETKKEIKEVKKEVKVSKKKFIPFTEKKKPKKGTEVKAIQKRISETKKHHPVFRGRFGKKQFRRKSIKKWDKWRKPHGIDIDRGLNHGHRPKTGYSGPANIRGMHPSGYEDVMVYNVNDLEKVNPKSQAGRISATVGKRKRNDIIAKANEKGIWILN